MPPVLLQIDQLTPGTVAGQELTNGALCFPQFIVEWKGAALFPVPPRWTPDCRANPHIHKKL